ncbi:MAG: alpha-amylase family glycosyl hydrolase [Chloroflexota bacterium]
MPLLPMDKLGAHEVADGVIHFGLLLPWVNGEHQNQVWVKIIHEQDQFLQNIQPRQFELSHDFLDGLGDYWSGQVVITANDSNNAASSWGMPGRYVYRYSVKSPNVDHAIDWVIDPYAREFGVGKLSAISVGYQDHQWSAGEETWRVPALHDLVIYELMLAEFGGDIDGAIDRLGYLADLGVNCVEVMPVSNVALETDWGFLPIGYFGVDERFGQRRDFQRFVDAAHQHGIAVIVDAVYGHTSDNFAYEYLYRRIGYEGNPFMGSYAKDLFGSSTDFTRPLVRDFFATVNLYWLDRYHVDGFRYDCVPNYWLGPEDEGYANLTYWTYQQVKAAAGGGYWRRFLDEDGHGPLRLIQLAEQLEAPQEILEVTYSNSTWQNGTLDAARRVARAEPGSLESLGRQFGLVGYPTEKNTNGDRIPKLPVQYIENHDQERFICNFGLIGQSEGVFQEGDRSRWYNLQPYLIGLLTSRGIPLLWQGQELCENYWLPNNGMARVMLLRPVRWDYFYDEVGSATVRLVRNLLALRRRRNEFRAGEHFFYNHHARYQSKGLLLFSRKQGDSFSLVALNFSDSEQWAPFWFPMSGDYREQLHGVANLTGVQALSEYWISIPSHYGRVWSIGP